MRMPILRHLVALVFILAAIPPCSASPQRYYSDGELAAWPIIVVARWEKAPFRRHDLEKDGVVERMEFFTKLHVLRVIKGDVKPGVHTLMINGWLLWRPDGTGLHEGISTIYPGDVDDVTQPNLWFLNSVPSWDSKDANSYLHIDCSRLIQPLALENYFAALADPQPGASALKLLASKDATVVKRTLLYPWEPTGPWPLGYIKDNESSILEKRGVDAGAWADAAAALAARSDMKELRPLAVAAYARLKGKEGASYLRGLLKDGDPQVRTVAAAELVRIKDADSIDAIIQTLNGKKYPDIADAMIEAIGAWGDPRLAPALIAYLETGGFYSDNGNILFVPALNAREALEKMTGCTFPYDAHASLQAWTEASKEEDAEKRRALLEKMLPADPDPLKAELIGDGSLHCICKVTNQSSRKITITRAPDRSLQEAPNGGGDMAGGEKKNKKDFVVLNPGESVESKFKLFDFMLFSEPAVRKIKIEYVHTGSEWGLKAWVGSVDVNFGEGWKEKRVYKDVVEKWPNGNLKEKGTTMNGKKSGKWEYFNEAGDRIRTEEHPGAVAEENPDHPDNKGAGKPQAAK